MAVTLTPLDGGKSLTREQIDREWQAAWALIAEACEAALTELHPLHPRRADLLRATRAARRAAALPAEPRLVVA
jgi:hypothetical protein